MSSNTAAITSGRDHQPLQGKRNVVGNVVDAEQIGSMIFKQEIVAAQK